MRTWAWRASIAALALAMAAPALAQFRWPWEPDPAQRQPAPPPPTWQPSAPQRGIVEPPPGQRPPARPAAAPADQRPERRPNLPAPPAARPQAEPIRNPIAEFAGLDKITGRIITFDVRLDETVQFGALQVTPRACTTRPASDEPFTTGFVQVDEVTLQNQIRQVFSGWMFAASPGLNAVEHPIYDVWLTNCKGTAIVIPRQGPTAGYEGAGPQEQDAPPTQPAPNVQRRSGPGAPAAPPAAPRQPSPPATPLLPPAPR